MGLSCTTLQKDFPSPNQSDWYLNDRFVWVSFVVSYNIHFTCGLCLFALSRLGLVHMKQTKYHRITLVQETATGLVTNMTEKSINLRMLYSEYVSEREEQATAVSRPFSFGH
ncbi:hypothetical protein KOW79_020107 [Hemibagrus wyckioides]|uniref:Uncharacterized protein n=1 Tax=Hemibagrus wyckioides TaxID=337641 RepID=A0A9D3S9P4_9TELE|nr:hypothetical protein KOW79_020107 [Hemibagrus wyckioides]